MSKEAPTQSAEVAGRTKAKKATVAKKVKKATVAKTVAKTARTKSLRFDFGEGDPALRWSRKKTCATAPTCTFRYKHTGPKVSWYDAPTVDYTYEKLADVDCPHGVRPCMRVIRAMTVNPIRKATLTPAGQRSKLFSHTNTDSRGKGTPFLGGTVNYARSMGFATGGTGSSSGDAAGHILAAKFGGVGKGRINIFPQDHFENGSGGNSVDVPPGYKKWSDHEKQIMQCVNGTYSLDGGTVLIQPTSAMLEWNFDYENKATMAATMPQTRPFRVQYSVTYASENSACQHSQNW